jgi:uncharacterized membrane protein
MKYSTEITLNLPRAEVIRKLDNIDNMKHWQRGLVSAEHLEGIPGKIGAKMKLKYELGKRKMELIETITKSDFPHEFHANYDTKGVRNIQENYFEELPDGKTKWRSDVEFHFTGFMMKMMGFLMPGTFKKQSMKYLQDFKAFVEHGESVANA